MRSTRRWKAPDIGTLANRRAAGARVPLEDDDAAPTARPGIGLGQAHNAGADHRIAVPLTHRPFKASRPGRPVHAGCGGTPRRNAIVAAVSIVVTGCFS